MARVRLRVRPVSASIAMLLVGLTGNIAAGKSTVARRLTALGATLVDADQLAREAVRPSTPALAAIVNRWGQAVLAPDGHLDRPALRRLVFERPDELEALNAIVHPEVARLRDVALTDARAAGARVVVCDVPLLFERDLAGDYDVLVLVDAPRELRLERLVHDRGLREPEAMAMIAAQMPAELKRARADYVIDNDGSRAQLEDRVAAVWRALDADAARGAARALAAAPTPRRPPLDGGPRQPHTR
jgi:dephospho-CoA kinase